MINLQVTFLENLLKKLTDILFSYLFFLILYFMKKAPVNKLSLLFVLIIFASSVQVFPQAGTYYDAIDVSSVNFVTDLQGRVRSPYTKVSYDNFDETNVANYASIDNGNGTRSVFCVYTGYEFIYSGTFAWTTMSREHTFCHSWMPTNPSTSTNEYADQHHLFPTHQNNANGRRSNHPLGIVSTPSYTFLDGKLGTNTSAQTVYEPRLQQKGDAARALLYMVLRYDGVNGNTWNFNWLNGTRLPALSEAPQSLSLLLDWHKLDPPDKWEIERNNYIQSIQQNRNPFIDHPEYVNYIDFNDVTKLSPSYSTEPANYVTGLTATPSGTTVNVSWTEAATGSQAPSGYLIVAYNSNNYFLPIDGEVYSDDTDLSDGAGIKNVAYADPDTYAFTGLPAGHTYYYTVYSYNGTGTSRNYKINGTLPQANATVTNSSTTVQFVSTSATVSEGVGTYNLVLSISNPSASVATTVDVALTSGSAADVNNYTTQQVTFPANSSSNQNVTLTITDDGVYEGDETLTFSLQNVSGGNSAELGSNTSFSLTIEDNDATTVQFTSGSTTVNEGDGTYQLTISITNPSPSTATTLDVVLNSGSASDINNYTTQQVTFPANTSANQTVTITITDDGATESNESFEFEIQNVAGGSSATAGSPSLFTLTIEDNDPYTTILLDNFNRTSSNTVGSTPTSPTSLTWNEQETINPSSIKIWNNRLSLRSTTSGYDWAYVDLSGLSGYPAKLSEATQTMTWAWNMRTNRSSPSGFATTNYGSAWILGKTGNSTASGVGYAVVIGNSGSPDSLRLIRFNAGLQTNSGHTNIITAPDVSTQFLSLKVTFNPLTNQWALYMESNASSFPQSDPRNTATQYGSLTTDATYIDSTLRYMGPLWAHATSSSDSMVVDDIYITDPGQVLPVELAVFEGRYTNGSVILQWTTATEVNNYGFTIERYREAADIWEEAGFVRGNGNSYSPKHYSFVDHSINGSSRFKYRLRQIDNDGTYSLSGDVQVAVFYPAEYKVMDNYPNPFNPATNLRFHIPVQQNVSVIVYNALGAKVFEEALGNLANGWHTYMFNAAGFASGTYIYEIRAGIKSLTGKMLLLK